MKWGKVSKGMLHICKQYADIFFAHPGAEFRCLVVDTHKIDYRAFHDNDREAAFFKFYSVSIPQSAGLSLSGSRAVTEGNGVPSRDDQGEPERRGRERKRGRDESRPYADKDEQKETGDKLRYVILFSRGAASVR